MEYYLSSNRAFWQQVTGLAGPSLSEKRKELGSLRGVMDYITRIYVSSNGMKCMNSTDRATMLFSKQFQLLLRPELNDVCGIEPKKNSRFWKEIGGSSKCHDKTFFRLGLSHRKTPSRLQTCLKYLSYDGHTGSLWVCSKWFRLWEVILAQDLIRMATVTHPN